MNFPQSSHDLNDPTSGYRRTSKRDSRRARISREMRDWQFKISNPFRNLDQQNQFPPNVLQKIQQMQYISSKSIKTIQLPQCRRTSNFMKNLQMMQELAKKQQQKYSGMVNEGPKSMNKKNIKELKMDLGPIRVNQDDDVSLELNGFYDYRERVQDDFNLFEKDGDDYMGAEQPVFYSKQEIQFSMMDEEFNNYLE